MRKVRKDIGIEMMNEVVGIVVGSKVELLLWVDRWMDGCWVGDCGFEWEKQERVSVEYIGLDWIGLANNLG